MTIISSLLLKCTTQSYDWQKVPDQRAQPDATAKIQTYNPA